MSTNGIAKKILGASWHINLSKHKKHTFQAEVTHIALIKDCVLPRASAARKAV
jgi:hypothetical protein